MPLSKQIHIWISALSSVKWEDMTSLCIMLRMLLLQFNPICFSPFCQKQSKTLIREMARNWKMKWKKNSKIKLVFWQLLTIIWQFSRNISSSIQKLSKIMNKLLIIQENILEPRMQFIKVWMLFMYQLKKYWRRISKIERNKLNL